MPVFSITPIVASSLLVLASGGADGVVCRPDKAGKINVIPSTAPLTYDASHSVKDLQNVKVDTVDPHGVGSGSVTQGFMEGQIAMQPHVRIAHKTFEEKNIGCLWYDDITVKIHITPKIVMAKEVYADPCMRAAVIEHEKKHVNVDRQVVNKYSKSLAKKLYGVLKTSGFYRGPIPADQMESTAKAMQNLIAQQVEVEYQRLTLERMVEQQKVDTLEEYQRVQSLCKGFNATAAMRTRAHQ